MNSRVLAGFHALWWITLLVAVAILPASLPGYGVLGATTSTASDFPGLVAALHWLGVFFSVSAAGVSIALAGLLFWKKPNDGMALYVSFFLLIYGSVVCGPLESLIGEWLPQYLYGVYEVENFLFFVPMLALILIFPNGHFAPRWSRWLVIAGVFFAIGELFFSPDEMVKFNTPRAIVFGSVGFGLIVAALALQAYRYRYSYSPHERQQTKWIAYGTLLLLGLLALVSIPYYYLINLPANTPLPWWVTLSSTGWWLGLFILPISFTVAILRSRLWDIDVIIRRTLTYALVAALLVVVYFGSVILLQQVFASVSGQRSEVITVLSTLAIAALFVPMRNRIQSVIDRRFNRKRYDAQQVLQEFATTVRDETDLEKLTGSLVGVVNETMQPRSVSLWLKRADEKVTG